MNHNNGGFPHNVSCFSLQGHTYNKEAQTKVSESNVNLNLKTKANMHVCMLASD